MTARHRVVVFASGRGSNFAALIEAQRRGELPIDIVALLSDKPAAPALALARAAGVEAVALSPREYASREDFDRAIFARAAQFAPDLIVLAGYMRIIDPAVVERWRGRMINIHPSLLPKYPGLHTHARAIQSGDAEHGASVHFVTPELDGGPVIAQVRLPIFASDTAESLARRLLSLEHRLLVAATRLVASGEIALDDNRVVRNGKPLAATLHLGADGELG
ncbi:phosphoribosylglycinamide formyltransferase [Rudaea sp.]|uniref:phosphoribosylglycinamide formyltransferase n=1 Tax=Rudaea sp. TaxID=2136325 RepID=UPI002ED137E7